MNSLVEVLLGSYQKHEIQINVSGVLMILLKNQS